MEPGVIRKLDEAVVNRIAAGEIIQRPANALKELIENSLDAKSNYIQVTVKSGGLKFLQIQDNGTGIRKDDLDIVCERFTTSKLEKFEDLTKIATYGFRGEALASISHVAHLTIQTKTAKDLCGYKASYEDGKLKAPPKAIASNQGTIITIEDLFYNMSQRRQCLKSPAEEYQKILDVVSKYAVHNASVSFTLKKFGETPSLKTNVNSTHEENIRTIFGSQISKELLPIELDDKVHRFEFKGFITKVNYAAKKGITLLFINHRLVDSTALRTAIDGVYSAYLPRGSHPFIYISLLLEPSIIDVNVHPTKHEVHFLYEDEIIEKIKNTIELNLLGSNSTRTFYKQLKLPGVSEETMESGEDADTSKSANATKVNPKNMIRTDAKEQKLDKFMNSNEMSVKLEKCDSGNSVASFSSTASSTSGISSQNVEESFRVSAARKSKDVRLTSVLNMRKRIEDGCSVLLRKTVKDAVFVGVVDKTFSLFQYETKLYLCNTLEYSEELFYQRLVYEFENFLQIKISPPLCVKRLIQIALDSKESGWTEEDGKKDELAQRATDILLEKSPIMREYFAMRINENGELETLPIVLSKHVPCTTFLPIYLLRLATEVEWEEEVACFETFCRETARFYALISDVEIQKNPQKHKWQVEHVLYPAMKQFLLPDNKLKKQLYELTNLPTLYKVFERC